MENILTLAGLTATAVFSFSLALLLGWMALAGLLRLLPGNARQVKNAEPARAAATIPLAASIPLAVIRPRRVRVVVAATRNRSGKVYTVRTA
jgi:hypothetical protein